MWAHRAAMADNIITVDEKRKLEALRFEIMKHVMGLLEDITR